MSPAREPIAAADLDRWLNAAVQRMNAALTGARRDEVIAALKKELGVDASFRLMASLSLLADCLRVAHLAIEADGQVDPEENRPRLPGRRGGGAPLFPGRSPATSRSARWSPGPSKGCRVPAGPQTRPGPLRQREPERLARPALCERVGDLARNETLVRDHERMLVRIMETVFAGRDTEVERSAHQELAELFERTRSAGRDPRVSAFCRPDGPEVFSSVAHGSQVFERDPFDVESIHGEARAVLHDPDRAGDRPPQRECRPRAPDAGERPAPAAARPTSCGPFAPRSTRSAWATSGIYRCPPTSATTPATSSSS